MKVIVPLILALAAATLAGCNDSSNNDPVPLHEPYTPATITVVQFREVPSKYVSWNQIPQNERPDELPALFSKALQIQPNGISGQEIEDDRGQAIIDGLNEQWRHQVGSTPPPPRPSPVYYNGEYYKVYFSHNETNTTHS